ncbi:MAG: LysR substrate-binding domain-containing protein [Pseudomonadota bacterium]
MIRSLPYTSLRAFEAVARLQSFSQAADEIGVSQSAVSQQVRTLEEWLGQPLLVRAARTSRPTEEGARLARVIADGLGGIVDACERLRETHRAERTVIINCLPGFAFIWLFPRLLSFDLAHPNITISITTEAGAAAGRADLGIRYGNGRTVGMIAEPLMGESVFPVCAPALVEGDAPLRGVGDLARHTLLRDEFSPATTDPPTWEFWASVNGLTLPKPVRSRTFGASNLVVQAAISGLGVALGRTPLVATALEEGRLVRPFAHEARSLCKYWLVYEERALHSERITLFLNWIKREAETAHGA